MKNVIITGSTGMIGVALIEYLISLNIVIYAIVRPKSTHIERLPKSPFVQIIECDLDSLRKLKMKPVDNCVMFHLAWEGKDKESRDNIQIQIQNIKWTIDAANLAQRINCKSFVFAGSQAEYGRVDGTINNETPTNPVTAYGMAKLCAESMTRLFCDNNGIKHCGLRIFSVYGKYDGDDTLISYLIRTIKQNQKPLLTSCDNIWNFHYVKDAARAIYLVAKKGTHKSTYNIASNDNRKLRYYVEELRSIINTKVEIGFGEISCETSQILNLNVDTNKLFEDTGFLPDFSFRKGIEEMIGSIQ